MGITLLTSILILLDALLPHFGLMLNFSNYGHSMEPTIKGNALLVISTPDRTPYESLEVGDVILFKEPKGLNTATDSIKVHIHPISPVSADSAADSLGSSSASDITTPDMPTEDEADELENIEYLPDRAVLHRIVAINAHTGIQGSIGEAGERILTTKGENNPVPDRYPVTADSYLGRMLWHVDYIGSVLLFLYSRFDALIIITTVSVTVVTILLRSIQFTA